jgi:hypothetical protein
MASITVDFPEPFSPTKNVTGEVKRSSRSDCTAGTLKGNSVAGSGIGVLREIDLRWIIIFGSPTPYRKYAAFHEGYLDCQYFSGVDGENA